MTGVSRTEVVTLAPMRRDHLAQVLRVDAAASPRPWSQAMFVTELGRVDRRYLVAERVTDAVDGAAASSGRIAGFAGVALLVDEAHVMTIAVDPAVQGRGVGAQLVRALLGEVARAGLTAATLEVRSSNDAARRLYRRAGFTEAGLRPGYYPDGEDAVIMWHRDVAEGS